jgi:hypothetical protein
MSENNQNSTRGNLQDPGYQSMAREGEEQGGWFVYAVLLGLYLAADVK